MAYAVLQKIEHRLEFPTDKNDSVLPINQLLLTLQYYATNSFLLTTGDLAGISKSTDHRIVHRVSAAIAELMPVYIKFPESPEEIRKAQVEFYSVASFRQVVGAIDRTHIRIASHGGEEAELFRNTKQYFSLNVGAICNANLLITDLVARWPGSAADC